MAIEAPGASLSGTQSKAPGRVPPGTQSCHIPYVLCTGPRGDAAQGKGSGVKQTPFRFWQHHSQLCERSK